MLDGRALSSGLLIPLDHRGGVRLSDGRHEGGDLRRDYLGLPQQVQSLIGDLPFA